MSRKSDQRPVTLTCPSCQGGFPGWAVHTGTLCSECNADIYLALKSVKLDANMFAMSDTISNDGTIFLQAYGVVSVISSTQEVLEQEQRMLAMGKQKVEFTLFAKSLLKAGIELCGSFDRNLRASSVVAKTINVINEKFSRS
ncbi:hypothetical protein ACEUAI_20845 [Aeromonas veronii]|nr:hypothetical protein [Aeromonas veronii]